MDADDLRAAGHGQQFWLEHVRLGLGMSATVIAMITVYLAMTGDRPHRPILWLVVGAAGLVTAVVSMLPWRRFVERGVALRFMVMWSLSLAPLIVLLTGFDGGKHSPMALLMLLPLVFAAMAYPFRTTILVGAVMVAAQLVVVALTPGVRLVDLLVESIVFVMIALMGAIIARNHGRSLDRAADLTDQLERLARVDSLTGCLNVRGFRERLEGEVARALRSRHPVALLHLDVDHFKHINDRFGHPTGDRALTSLGQLLTSFARRSDAIARVGGEEFALLLPETDLAEACEMADRLRRAVRALTDPVAMTASVGVAAIPRAATTEDDLVASADRALYAAKRAGRDRVVSAPTQSADAPGHLHASAVSSLLEQPVPIRATLEPIVDVTTGRVHGLQSTWTAADGTAAPPWLTAAAQEGRQGELEAAVWEASLAAFERTPAGDGLALVLDASPDGLRSDALWARRHRLPGRTVIQLAEPTTRADAVSMARAIARWRAAGHPVGISEFGTGHTSLRTLVELAPTYLTLAPAIVGQLATHAPARDMVTALLELTDRTGGHVVASGVHDVRTLQVLGDLGVPLARGPLLTPATPSAPARDVTAARSTMVRR